MSHRNFLLICFSFFISLCSAQEKPLHVVFFNPGAVVDIGVWHLTSNFMQAAANDLGLNLEIIYSDRDHIKMLEQVNDVAKRVIPPDYIILVNEKLTGEKMLLTLQGTQSKILLIHNDLTQEQRLNIGSERSKITNWIGTVTTDDYLAGYLQIQQLYQHSIVTPKIVAITGNEATPVSEIRAQGLRDYIKDAKHGTLYQVIHGEWAYEHGKNIAHQLLQRYEDTNMIWAANDSMALGAYDTVKILNKENEVIVGGLGGFPDALDSIISGGLTLTIAGHPMIGAWALVLLYDYHHGDDFADEIGVNIKVNHLTVIDNPTKAKQYRRIIIENPDLIDFKSFTKKMNTDVELYDFSYANVISTAN
jgi:ABC-type sugar transport system substrate-binding protein